MLIFFETTKIKFNQKIRIIIAEKLIKNCAGVKLIFANSYDRVTAGQERKLNKQVEE